MQKVLRKALAEVAAAVPEDDALEELVPLREEVSEEERLATLEALRIKEDRPDPDELQRIVESVARRFGVSASFISVVMEENQWLRASVGVKGKLLGDPGIPRGESFCTHVVQSGAPLLVPDAAVHPYFKQNPLVQEGLLRSYAGAPLTTPSGAVIGSLCIIDNKPMNISATDVDELVTVARQVAGEIELSASRKRRAAGKMTNPGMAAVIDVKLSSWFDAVLDTIGDGVLLFDEQRTVILASRGLVGLLAVQPEALLGLAHDALLGKLAPRFADPDQFTRQLEVPRNGPYAIRTELPLAGLGGMRGRLLRCVIRPVLLEQALGHLCVFTDVIPRAQ